MSNAPAVVMLFIALFSFVVVFYGPWQTLCIGWARQEMFEARNALFTLAEKGVWSFDSQEYREIRSEFEGVIRFAHRISWPRLLVVFFMPPIGFSGTPAALKLLERIDDDNLRCAVLKEFHNIARAAIMLLVWRSLILMVVVGFTTSVYSLCKPLRRNVRDVGFHIFASIEGEAQRSDIAQGFHRRAA